MIAAFFAGALVTFVVAAVFFGTVTKQQAERIRSLQAIIFGLEQDILHMDEGKDERLWQLRSDGVDVEVVRGRPDIPKNRSTRQLDPSEMVAGEVVDLKYVFGEDTFDD